MSLFEHPTREQINALATTVRASLRQLSDAELLDFLDAFELEHETNTDFHPVYWTIHAAVIQQEIIRRGIEL